MLSLPSAAEFVAGDRGRHLLARPPRGVLEARRPGARRRERDGADGALRLGDAERDRGRGDGAARRAATWPADRCSTLSPYLDYVEEEIVGVVPLSEGAIATERGSFAAVETLAAQAEAAGFYLGGGARVSPSTGRELTLIDFIADAATTTIVREGDLVLATTLSPGKARIATAGGGMEWQFTGGARELSGDWLDDTPGSLGVQASSAAKPITWGDCFTNCALTDKDMTYDMVARAQELGNSFLNTGECRKWLAKVKRGERNLDGWLLCKPALESSLNVGGVISQTLMDCAWTARSRTASSTSAAPASPWRAAIPTSPSTSGCSARRER